MGIYGSHFNTHHLVDERERTGKIHDAVVVRTGRKKTFAALGGTDHEHALFGAEHRFADLRRIGVNRSLQTLQTEILKQKYAYSDANEAFDAAAGALREILAAQNREWR